MSDIPMLLKTFTQRIVNSIHHNNITRLIMISTKWIINKILNNLKVIDVINFNHEGFFSEVLVFLFFFFLTFFIYLFGLSTGIGLLGLVADL
jgi:uncharacterized protein YacL